MAMAVRAIGTMNDIVAGQGDVPLDVALAALASGIGIVAFTKKVKLWSKLTPAERAEARALDAAAPTQFLRGIGERFSAALFASGKTPKLKWFQGPFKFGGTPHGNVFVSTPVLDEETGELTV